MCYSIPIKIIRRNPWRSSTLSWQGIPHALSKQGYPQRNFRGAAFDGAGRAVRQKRPDMRLWHCAQTVLQDGAGPAAGRQMWIAEAPVVIALLPLGYLGKDPQPRE